MEYPLDYKIGVSHLPDTTDMGNEEFARAIMKTMDENASFCYEIFYAAMLLAAERMISADLLGFLLEVGRHRDVVLAGHGCDR